VNHKKSPENPEISGTRLTWLKKRGIKVGKKGVLWVVEKNCLGCGVCLLYGNIYASVVSGFKDNV